MKATIYKLVLLLALSPTIAFCTNSGHDKEFEGRITKEKKVSKKFNVAADAILKIDNSYGNIDISTWDQNTVSIEVFIKTNGNDEEKVQQKLDEIRIEFNQTSAGVSAKTHFSKESNSFWNMLFSNNSNVNMEINYIIKAPVTNNVDLRNDYGNIFIDKLKGNSKISCNYGRIDIGELLGTSNHINFDYSRNSHFNYINKAVINSDYSDFTIVEAGSLNINADYTKSHIKKVELIQFTADYGSMNVDKLKRIVGNGDYISVKLGQVFQSADLNLDYGNLEIDKVIKGAGEIKITSSYAGVKIGYAEDHPFQFNINTSYGNVKGMDNFEVDKQNQTTTSKSYSGYHLNNSAGSTINIKSNYAGITFNQK
ncbi:MAG: hypothetical protein R6W85_00430 [Gillisia sp.]